MSLELQGYERYKLEWMIEHGYSLKDLMDALTQQEGYLNIKQVFNDWESYAGFEGSEIWACKEEWEDNEKTGNMKYYVETGWCGNWDELCNYWDAYYSDENAEWFSNFDEAQQRYDWLANSSLGKIGVYVTLCDNDDKEILRFETDNEGNVIK